MIHAISHTKALCWITK